MSDFHPPTHHTAGQDGPPGSGPAISAHPLDSLRTSLIRATLITVGAIIATGIAAVAYLLFLAPDMATELNIAVAVALFLVAIGIGFFAVRNIISTADSVGQWVGSMRRTTVETHYELWQMSERMRASLPPNQQPPITMPITDPGNIEGREFGQLLTESQRLRQASQQIAWHTANAPVITVAEGGDKRVGVFVNLARRLQSLVHREIQLLDELEAQVEDPDLLKGLFAVDHLATRIRRHAENLAVLGGAGSRRQWSRPVNVYEVLRSSVAEVEQYARVKMIRPVEGTLKGHAVADVIHLVAELVENATSFSSPNTQVLLRAQRVTAGLAIEVEDRGLGMPQVQQAEINQMLSRPDDVDVDELLADGRIGLYVVASLARRHEIAVQLQTNIFGGTQAVIVLSCALLGDDEPKKTAPKKSIAAPPPSEPTPAPVSNPMVNAAARSSTSASDLPDMPVRPVPQPSPVPTGRHSQRTLPTAGNGHQPSAVPQGMAVNPEPVPNMTPPLTPMPSSPPPPPPPPSNTEWSSAPFPTPERPRLPQRRKNANLAPQLMEAPVTPSDVAPEHNPNLMMSFQEGINRAGHGSNPADSAAENPEQPR